MTKFSILKNLKCSFPPRTLLLSAGSCPPQLRWSRTPGRQNISSTYSNFSVIHHYHNHNIKSDLLEWFKLVDLAHPTEGRQAWSIEATLIGRSQNDEHLSMKAFTWKSSWGSSRPTSISLLFLSLTMSFSSIRSLLPLSVKTTTRDLGEAFCRATSRPWIDRWIHNKRSRRPTSIFSSLPVRDVLCCPSLRCSFQTWAPWSPAQNPRHCPCQAAIFFIVRLIGAFSLLLVKLYFSWVVITNNNNNK